MTPNEFIAKLKRQVCDGAADAVLAALSKPPGKRPSARDVRLSEWFNQQSSTKQALVREIIVEAVEQATFNFLAVLDGVATLTDGTGDTRYELRCMMADDSFLLNDPNSEELHRLFSHTDAIPSTKKNPTLEPYEVGKFAELKQRQSSVDALHLHRIPPKFAASNEVVGYDPLTASSIALPQGEHRRLERE